MARQMTTHGVLLLSHCGYSFLEDLIAALDARGLRTFVLSSLPLAEHCPQRLDELQRKVTRLLSTGAHEVFLGQLLWRLDREERDATLPALIRASADAIEIRYAQQTPVVEGVPS